MLNLTEFRTWLKQNTLYSPSVISDTISRMKRADSIHPWDGTETYLFYLERKPDFQQLSCSVRSQIRKAVGLYDAFLSANTPADAI